MRITVDQAAVMLGISPQAVRVQMQRKIIDIGYIAGTKEKRTYIIFENKVRALMGEK